MLISREIAETFKDQPETTWKILQYALWTLHTDNHWSQSKHHSRWPSIILVWKGSKLRHKRSFPPPWAIYNLLNVQRCKRVQLVVVLLPLSTEGQLCLNRKKKLSWPVSRSRIKTVLNFTGRAQHELVYSVEWLWATHNLDAGVAALRNFIY